MAGDPAATFSGRAFSPCDPDSSVKDTVGERTGAVPALGHNLRFLDWASGPQEVKALLTSGSALCVLHSTLACCRAAGRLSLTAVVGADPQDARVSHWGGRWGHVAVLPVRMDFPVLAVAP